MKLTRKKVKELLDSGILQAYADSETIELLNDNGKVWTEFGPDEKMSFDCDTRDYRVKQKYRCVTNDDIGKVVEVSMYGDLYEERIFVTRFEDKFYCKVDGANDYLTGWPYARVRNE